MNKKIKKYTFCTCVSSNLYHLLTTQRKLIREWKEVKMLKVLWITLWNFYAASLSSWYVGLCSTRRNKIIWDDMKVSKWWQIFHFWLNYFFNATGLIARLCWAHCCRRACYFAFCAAIYDPRTGHWVQRQRREKLAVYLKCLPSCISMLQQSCTSKRWHRIPRGKTHAWDCVFLLLKDAINTYFYWIGFISSNMFK